ncbi:ABC transporter permease [Bordetella sp. 15P40C-2]|uniref:ABC transporter permease n=1 Tax=Bordetella sp. 15P40C-2 TaxID=2572246 RepID=UPI001323770A|nr:ABC transporter permease [Bordetella sp. 15P40C-2]MVW73298.1 ABC transporter permease [Bordetella sp. 15P40C-2]
MKRRSPLEITRAVVFALLLREMRARFGQRRMGAFWMLAEPVIQLIVMTVLIGIIRGRSDIQAIPFPVFLLSGIAPFVMFRGVATLIMEGLAANRGLFAYKQVTPMDTFVARTILQCSLSCISYLIVALAFAWYGYDMTIAHPLEWLALLAVGVGLSFGLGMVLAVVIDLLPELRTFVRFAFLVLYFSSGAVFPVSRFPSYVLPYVQWNPFLHLIELIREAAFPFYRVLDVTSLAYVLASTAILLCTGLGLFKVRKNRMLAIKGIV